jgi:hypothetical protein
MMALSSLIFFMSEFYTIYYYCYLYTTTDDPSYCSKLYMKKYVLSKL